MIKKFTYLNLSESIKALVRSNDLLDGKADRRNSVIDLTAGMFWGIDLDRIEETSNLTFNKENKRFTVSERASEASDTYRYRGEYEGITCWLNISEFTGTLIHESNFPDDNFRSYVLETIDSGFTTGILTINKINAVRAIHVSNGNLLFY